MKEIILAICAIAVAVPALAFEPIPVPHCTPGPNATAALCNFEATMAMSYNDKQGKMPDSISECAGITDEVLEHHITAGLSHDRNVMICTEVADHLGILPNIYR